MVGYDCDLCMCFQSDFVLCVHSAMFVVCLISGFVCGIGVHLVLCLKFL